MVQQNEKIVTGKKITLELLAVLFLFLACVFLFTFIADAIVKDKDFHIDASVSGWVAEHITPSSLQFMKGLSFFGSHSFLIPAYVLFIIFLLWKKKNRYALYVFIIALTSTAAMFALKEIFQRQRPTLLSVDRILGNYSFPSGHSVSSVIFCSVLGYLVWRRPWKPAWKWLATIFLLIFCFGIGLSRIVLNVHYPTDVIAGFCFGIVWVLVSIFVMRRIEKRSESGPDSYRDSRLKD